MNESAEFKGGQSNPESRRRARYAGTHPRRFEQRYKELHPERYPDMQPRIRAQGRTPAGAHVPVLLVETLEHLSPKRGDVVVDCTLGHGGHAAVFAEKIAPNGRLIALDIDGVELERTRQRLVTRGVPLEARHASYAGLDRVLAEIGIEGCDVLHADLGVSSMQIDNPVRGFSYKHDGPLDMRMGERSKRTAAQWLERADEIELTAAFRDLADEPRAAEIAQAIVRRRAVRRLETTRDLAAVITEAAPDNAATLASCFQAIRIRVNDELSALSNLLRIAPSCLRAGGRFGVISFHSGEDRLVKRALRAGHESGQYAAISAEPIVPCAEERRSNPRSRSARFRWAVRA